MENMETRAPFEVVYRDVLAAEEATEEIAKLDAGFDGGEFSGPAHARALEKEIRGIVNGYGWTMEEFSLCLEEAQEAGPFINLEEFITFVQEHGERR